MFIWSLFFRNNDARDAMILNADQIIGLINQIFPGVDYLEKKKVAIERFRKKNSLVLQLPVNDPNRPAVLKFFSLQTSDSTEQLDQEKADVLGQVRIINSFSQDPGVIRLYDYDELWYKGELTGVYLIMERVPYTLDKLLSQPYSFSEVQVYSFLAQMDRVLHKAHKELEMPIVHSDIKPANIGVRENQTHGFEYVLMDFDVAIHVQQTGYEEAHFGISNVGQMRGLTPAYAPPEQVMAHLNHSADITNRVDIYSVGAIAMQMLTGRPPMSKSSESFFSLPWQHLNGQWEGVFKKLCDPNPRNRVTRIHSALQDITDLRAALEASVQTENEFITDSPETIIYYPVIESAAEGQPPPLHQQEYDPAGYESAAEQEPADVERPAPIPEQENKPSGYEPIAEQEPADGEQPPALPDQEYQPPGYEPAAEQEPAAQYEPPVREPAAERESPGHESPPKHDPEPSSSLEDSPPTEKEEGAYSINATFVSNASRNQWLRFFLSLSFAAVLLSLMINILLTSGGLHRTGSLAGKNVVDGIALFCFIGSLIQFIRWMLGAYTNLQFSGIRNLKFPTPNSISGSPFPLAYLLWPYPIIKDIWVHTFALTNNRSGENTSIISWWWGLMLVSLPLEFFLIEELAGSAEAFGIILFLQMPVSLLSMVAIYLTHKIVADLKDAETILQISRNNDPSLWLDPSKP